MRIFRRRIASARVRTLIYIQFGTAVYWVKYCCRARCVRLSCVASAARRRCLARNYNIACVFDFGLGEIRAFVRLLFDTNRPRSVCECIDNAPHEYIHTQHKCIWPLSCRRVRHAEQLAKSRQLMSDTARTHSV